MSITPPKEAALEISASGKDLLHFALDDKEQKVQLDDDHIVDENSKEMRKHGIISVPKGSICILLNGSLQEGLGGKYKDYVEVSYNGKVGKVSRHILVLV